MITDRDIVVRAVAEGRNPLSLTASACLTSPVITIREEASLDECTDLMEAKQIRRLLVVDESGALIGIVAQADVARHASRKDAGELVRDVSAPSRYIQGFAPRTPHTLSRAASPARSVRVAHPLPLVRARRSAESRLR